MPQCNRWVTGVEKAQNLLVALEGAAAEAVLVALPYDAHTDFIYLVYSYRLYIVMDIAVGCYARLLCLR